MTSTPEHKKKEEKQHNSFNMVHKDRDFRPMSLTSIDNRSPK